MVADAMLTDVLSLPAAPARTFPAGVSLPFGSLRMRSLLLGQVISVLITATGVLSSLLAEQGIDIPVTQSSMNYFMLSFHLLWAVARIRQEGLAMPAWRYALWAVCDVEANFLVVWAYQYTSISSVMLLDCLAIPCAMAFSRLALGARYSWRHVVACLVCVAGLVLTVASDVLMGKVGKSPSGPAWFGDVLVLCGAVLYGASNVQQEWLMKRGGRRCEALGMLGVCGTLISCFQAAILERTALERCVWSTSAVISLVGFQLCLFAMYTIFSAFLAIADVTLFNLSILTSDFYSVLYSWQVQGGSPSWMYAGAFSTTLFGLVFYNTQPMPSVVEQPGCGACGEPWAAPFVYLGLSGGAETSYSRLAA